jgi:hypothetical protein
VDEEDENYGERVSPAKLETEGTVALILMAIFGGSAALLMLLIFFGVI